MSNVPTPAPQGPKLAAKPAVLHATITIKRKATGKVETYQLTGTALPTPEKKD